MTTAVLKFAMSIGKHLETLKKADIYQKIFEVVEFVALLSLPILLPFGLIWITVNANYPF